MANLQPMKPGAFEGDQDADDLWPFCVAVAKNVTAINAEAEQKITSDDAVQILSDRFAIIYPNGGSEASPATITANQRFVTSNPFPGRMTACKVELLINNQWLDPRWGAAFVSPNMAFYGTRADQLNDDDIVAQSAPTKIIAASGETGNASGVDSTASLPHVAPIRVKVWVID